MRASARQARVASSGRCTALRNVVSVHRCRVAVQATAYPAFVPPIVADITDPDALKMVSQMRRVPITVPGLGNEPLRTAVVGPTGDELLEAGCGPNDPVLVLIHSFDSSSLEWRRTYPLLAQQCAMPVVAIDLVGWGFTDHAAWRRNPLLPVTPETKRAHLEAFRQQHLGGRPVVLAGTSLGGTIAADYALAYPEAVRKLVLVDAQGFTSGVPTLPRPLAALGVQVLRQPWLRESANQMAYYNKAKFATPDALRVGRLHTFLPGWLEANVAFIQSGGYDMSEGRIKQIGAPMLLLWGEADEIIPPATGERWLSTLGPSRCKFVRVAQAGHSPHLERPEFVCQQILEFLQPATAQEEPAANVAVETTVETVKVV